MRKELLLALTALAVLAAYYGTRSANVDAFEQWKGEFGVTWTPQEEPYRRMIFEKNLLLIEQHNADPTQTYQKGVNQFTIYTEEEFKERFLTPMPLLGAPSTDEIMLNIGDIDWVSKGDVSRVKNQGNCGSCWAFSATGVTESFFRLKGQKPELSEQQLVDCSGSYGNHGCNGGWPSNALKYIEAHGISTESEYPYTAKGSTCKKTGGSYKISGYSSFSGCSGLSSGIQSHPISVTVDASKWSSYKSGVFSSCGKSIDHAVLLVGVIGGNWKIKNSWGSGWGESGYIRLASGDTCGVCSYAGVYPK